ncbi:MAG: AAA family ATPase [Cyanobacteria bacterium HKST-UBA06]|nr:AAA family ATPase [Cyanobacteria bacterium HKST-UBA06]
MLDAITIHGYRSIESAIVDFGQVNLLVGEHGSGKSNLLDCLNLLYHIGQSNCQGYVNHILKDNNALYSWFSHIDEEEGEVPQVSMTCHFRKNQYHVTLGPQAPYNVVFHDESAGFVNDKGDYKVAFEGQNHLETRLTEENLYTVAPFIRRAFESFQVYHFAEALDPQRIASRSDLDDNKQLRPDASNIAAVLYRIKQHYPSRYHLIDELFRQTEPGFNCFDLEPDKEYTRLIECRWRHRHTLDSYKMSHLGIGTRRFLCLLVLLLQPTPPSVILIDEVELGLTPKAQQIIGGLIRNLGEEHQVIVTTASPTFIDQFEPQHLILCESVDGRSQYTALAEIRTDWSEARQIHTTGQLWQNNWFSLAATAPVNEPVTGGTMVFPSSFLHTNPTGGDRPFDKIIDQILLDDGDGQEQTTEA